MNKISAFFAFSLLSATCVAGNCRTDLGFLQSKLPSFGVSLIDDVRDSIVREDITDAMKKASKMGVSHSQVVGMMLNQAKEHDRIARDSLVSASMVDVAGMTDDDFAAAIKSRTIRVENCDGIRNASICNGIVNKMGALGMRAAAAELQCHDRAGTWAY